jgi:NAD(P)H-flavin reductase
MARTALRRRLTWQAATVTAVTRETASVVTIELEPPDWPGHRAGQHLEVRLTAEDGYTAERQYTGSPAHPRRAIRDLRGREPAPRATSRPPQPPHTDERS